MESTGSEPLSFEEEVKMQLAWRDDPEKCTFIVHETSACHHQGVETNFVVTENLDAMVGDVNLFLSEIDEDENSGQGEAAAETDGPKRVQAEIDIMIAEKQCHRKGLGRAATCSMLLYGARKLKVERFFCKINEDNMASINLFKALGFTQCDYAACFKQVELELRKPLVKLESELEPYGLYKEVVCPQ